MPDEEEPEPPKASSTLMSRLGPWLLLASIAMALLYIMRSCGGRPSEEKITQEIQTPEETGEKAAPESQISTLIEKTDTTDLTGATIRKVANGVAYITLPDGKDISTSAGSFLDKIYTFLSSENKDADNRFTFENLTFQPDTTLLAPSSTPQMQNLATLLKAYPTVLLHIQAYTGGGDDPAINKTWSEESAASVKTALSVLGVSNDRITTQGSARTSGGDTPSDGVRNRDQRIDLFLKK
jgi:outer membrane protein OmpA-like peptidoglycan-associated protein